MNRVIAMLNACVQSAEAESHISKAEARIALHAIETQQLAVTALRQIVTERKGMGTSSPSVTEALNHAERFLKLHDDYVAKHTAPNPVELAPAKNLVEDQDVADLV